MPREHMSILPPLCLFVVGSIFRSVKMTFCPLALLQILTEVISRGLEFQVSARNVSGRSTLAVLATETGQLLSQTEVSRRVSS